MINLDCDDVFEIPDMRVPTCQLQQGFGPDSVGVVPYPKEFVELQSDAEAFYGRRGVNILATCTPYQVGNLPVRGEHCAWMESSAVVYANSVLGARTNCEGGTSTGAASLTGKIPCWGNHLPENRFGTHLVEADAGVRDFMDWGMLGYFAGGLVQDERPVVTGAFPQSGPRRPQALRRGRRVFRRGRDLPPAGITPEAPTVEAAFGGRLPSAVHYGARERREVYETLNDQGRSTDVDFVLLGCPHASIDQIRAAARALDGKRLHSGTQLWIMTPRALKASRTAAATRT